MTVDIPDLEKPEIKITDEGKLVVS